MSTERFMQRLSRIHPVTDALKRSLLPSLRTVTLPKGHVLVDPLRGCDQLMFLDKGFCISVTFDKMQKETEWIWAPGEFIISPSSFFNQSPATEIIEIVQTSDLVLVSRETLQQLSVRFPEIDAIFHNLLSEYLDASRRRIRELQSLNAELRLENLVSTHHGIEQVLTQAQIASYLGITVQTISRLRKSRLRH